MGAQLVGLPSGLDLSTTCRLFHPLVLFLLLEMPMFSDFERVQRLIIALALIVLALDLFYWRP
jgi:hypothetical protein